MIYRRFSAKESTLMKDLHGLYVYHPARKSAIADLDATLAVTQTSHRPPRPKYLA